MNNLNLEQLIKLEKNSSSLTEEQLYEILESQNKLFNERYENICSNGISSGYQKVIRKYPNLIIVKDVYTDCDVIINLDNIKMVNIDNGGSCDMCYTTVYEILNKDESKIRFRLTFDEEKVYNYYLLLLLDYSKNNYKYVATERDSDYYPIEKS